MEQSPSWEANWFCSQSRNSQHFMEPKGSLPHSQVPTTCPKVCPGSRLTLWLFCNTIRFYSKELLTPRPTPKLKDHPLSVVCDCLFNMFAATLHICRPYLHPQPEGKPGCGDRDPLIMESTQWILKLHTIPWVMGRHSILLKFTKSCI
jgi:hypothetical protein